MAPTHVLGVIPARMGASRLPGKPLRLVAGLPLLEWVWRAVARLQVLDAAVVATDSDDVADLCRRLGAPVEITGSAHRSGTERVAEVATRSAFAGYGVIVNIQGDEPFVTARQVELAASLVGAAFDIGTVATPLRTIEAWKAADVVKVVVGDGGRALYFSRAPIPYPRDAEPSTAELATSRYLRHVGVYAYTREALARWVALPASPLEETEKLEQLRPLAAGLAVGVGIVDSAEGGVDTEDDLIRAERRLAARPAESQLHGGRTDA